MFLQTSCKLQRSQNLELLGIRHGGWAAILLVCLARVCGAPRRDSLASSWGGVHHVANFGQQTCQVLQWGYRFWVLSKFIQIYNYIYWLYLLYNFRFYHKRWRIWTNFVSLPNARSFGSAFCRMLSRSTARRQGPLFLSIGQDFDRSNGPSPSTHHTYWKKFFSPENLYPFVSIIGQNLLNKLFFSLSWVMSQSAALSFGGIWRHGGTRSMPSTFGKISARLACPACFVTPAGLVHQKWLTPTFI